MGCNLCPWDGLYFGEWVLVCVDRVCSSCVSGLGCIPQGWAVAGVSEVGSSLCLQSVFYPVLDGLKPISLGWTLPVSQGCSLACVLARVSKVDSSLYCRGELCPVSRGWTLA